MDSKTADLPDDFISIAAFSHAVECIYDCAFDPARWPQAIGEVCAAARCMAGVIGVTDLTTGAGRLQQQWNYGPDWQERMVRHAPEIAEVVWRGIPDLHTRPLDEPLVLTREISLEAMQRTRYYQEWVGPQGVIDAISLTVLRQRDRLGEFSMSRHESAGAVTDRDVAVVRLLAPHFRRAVAISDVLNMQTIKIDTFQSAFDLLQAGVLFADHDCKIIHANRAARAMLDKGSPIQSVHGELKTQLPQTTAALKKAVAVAMEPAIGRMGIGVPVPQPEGDPAYIHVLPLMSGDTRSRLAPRASAALFVTVKDGGAGPPAEAIAAVFDLSPAEIRILQRLLAGRAPAEIADDLGLAVPTVRSHLASIYAKTGTSRQSDLIRLATQLAGPVEQATMAG
jgi:DNA-binding CsgD family transcriptional regulator/PAS domain-containing protein